MIATAIPRKNLPWVWLHSSSTLTLAPLWLRSAPALTQFLVIFNKDFICWFCSSIVYTFFAFMPNAPLFGSISATALAPLQLGSLPYIINILMIIKFFFVVLLPPPFPKLYTHRLGRLRTRCAISGLLYTGCPKKIYPSFEIFFRSFRPKSWGHRFS